MADYNLQSKQNEAMGVYNKGPKSPQKGFLAAMIASPQGQQQYDAMSAAARLGMLQDAMKQNPHALNDRDMVILNLLRRQRENDANFYTGQNAQQAQQPQPGFLARLFGGYNQLNQSLGGQ